VEVAVERDRRRWEGDTNGIGVADGSAFRPNLDSLAASMSKAGWVAEEPETHLLPALLERLQVGDLRLRFVRSYVADATLVVELAAGSGRPADIRRDAFALLGVVAESATMVREVASPDTAGGRRFEVATGSLDGDSQFAGHGHLLRLVVATPAGAD
jgi:hypothetical protein